MTRQFFSVLHSSESDAIVDPEAQNMYLILQSRAAQPEALDEAVLCGQQGLFARLKSSWKGLPFCSK